MGIPRTDDGIQNYASNILTQSTRNKAAWGISEVDLATLKERFDDYDAKLTTSKTPDRRKSCQ